jgi:hypothetical protein
MLVSVSGRATEAVLVKLAVSMIPGPPETLQLAFAQLSPPLPVQVTTFAVAKGTVNNRAEVNDPQTAMNMRRDIGRGVTLECIALLTEVTVF